MTTNEDHAPTSALERQLDRNKSKKDGWALLTFVLAGFALLVGVVGVAFGLRAIDKSDDGGGGVSATGEKQTFDIELGDIFLKPKSIEVPAGTEVVVKATNNGAMEHDLKRDGKDGTDLLKPGSKAEVSLGVFTESGQAWCTVPGHKEAGMLLDIKVTGAAATGSGGTGSTASGDFATIDFNAEFAADFKPHDPKLAPAPGGKEHKVTFRATEKVIEIAPGVTQELWTFNDTVPGPVLRGKVGDIFTITLVNEGKIGHSIDFHASKVAWNDEMRTIQPGESLVYQFEAKHAGAWMYHCGTAPVLHHIGNGMYGAIIIDPPNLPAVDHEFLFVQSEFYLGPEGKPGDLTKMKEEQNDAVVFNGYVNQYLNNPIRVEPNQRIRAWVVDDGPSEDSAFHIVGTIWDTVFKEGTYDLQPDARQGGSQVLDLQPAQGGFVEFTFDEAGLYPIVTHKFANASKGALGLFQAGEVEDAPAGGH